MNFFGAGWGKFLWENPPVLECVHAYQKFFWLSLYHQEAFPPLSILFNDDPVVAVDYHFDFVTEVCYL